MFMQGGDFVRFKNWIIFFLTSSVLLFGVFPKASQSAVFSSDSISQEVGDNYIMELILNRNQSIGAQLGMRQRLTVSTLNQTDGAWGYLADCLYANLSWNTPNDRTWIFAQTDDQLLRYNSSHGMGADHGFAFVPHNETALNASLHAAYTFFPNNKWTNGPHGYDGIWEMWSGSETGDLYKQKTIIQFNEEGVMQFQRYYNGTGSNWEITDELYLQTPLKPLLQIPVQTDTRVILSWNQVINASVYYIYRSTAPLTQLSWQDMVPLSQTTATAIVDLAVPLGTYYYAIVAGNAVANSSISVNMRVTVTSPNTDISGFFLNIFVISFIVTILIWQKRQKFLAH